MFPPPLFSPNQSVYARSYGEVHLGYVMEEAEMSGGEYWYKVRFVGGAGAFPEELLSAVDESHSVVVSDFSGYQLKSGSYLNGFYKYHAGEDLKRSTRTSKESLQVLFDANYFAQADASISMNDFLLKRGC